MGSFCVLDSVRRRKIALEITEGLSGMATIIVQPPLNDIDNEVRASPPSNFNSYCVAVDAEFRFMIASRARKREGVACHLCTPETDPGSNDLKWEYVLSNVNDIAVLYPQIRPIPRGACVYGGRFGPRSWKSHPDGTTLNSGRHQWRQR